MNRRGFLSLVGFGAAALAVERALPAAFKPPALLEPEELLAAPPQLMRFCLAFQSELGFQEIVEPGGIVKMFAMPQLCFRPDRLVFAEADLSKFDLLQVEVPDVGEVRPLLAGAVPAEHFSPAQFGLTVPTAFGVTAPGEQIWLALRNRSNVDAELRGACMIGTALR